MITGYIVIFQDGSGQNFVFIKDARTFLLLADYTLTGPDFMSAQSVYNPSHDAVIIPIVHVELVG